LSQSITSVSIHVSRAPLHHALLLAVAHRSGGRVIATDLDSLGAAVVKNYLGNRRRLGLEGGAQAAGI
jgi:uncharacterized coiled-coil protein SlyX